MKNKYMKLLFIISQAFLLAGCWDNVELNQRHIVLDVAVDKADQSLEGSLQKRPEYTVTYAIPDIAKLSGNDSLSQDVKTVVSVNSPTIAKSIHDIEAKTQNTISFSHTKAILFGRELMEDSELFKAAVDSFRENTEVGRGTFVLAVDGNAGDLSKAESYQNPIIGLYLMKYFNNEERAAGDHDARPLGVFSRQLQETHVSTLPLISVNAEEATLKLSGAALIKDYQLIDLLSSEEVRAQLFIEGKVKGIPIVVKDKEQYDTYQISHETGRVEFTETGGQLTADIYIDVEGKLVEYDPSVFQSSDREQKLLRIRELVNEEISKEINMGIEKEKAVNVDYLQLSTQLFRKYPKLFEKYHMLWEEGGSLSSMAVNLHVNTTIQDVGTM